jgi:HSP20 family protein
MKEDVMTEQTMQRADTTNGGLRRRDPMDFFTALQQDMERYLQFPFGFGPVLPVQRDGGRRSTFLPRMDVYEKDNTLIFQAELPGLKKDDVRVEIDDGDLVIRGEARTQDQVKDDAYHRTERTYGSFYRRVPLPGDVKPEQVTAKLADGVLEVTIPKPAEAKAEADVHQIPVQQ